MIEDKIVDPVNGAPKSLMIFWVLLGIITLSAFIPARWFGVKPKVHTRLDLQALNTMSSLSLDKNKNNNPDWRDLLKETFSFASTSDISKNATFDASAQKLLDDPNNLTASFSKNLYTASAYLNKNNITDSQTQQQLIESMIADENSKIIVKLYSINDLKISKVESAESIKRYGNNLGAIFNQALKYKLGDGDIEIIQAFTVNKDASVLSSLKIKKGRASEIMQQLLSTSVPVSASVYHLLTINKLSAYITALDNMSHADTDSVRATISFKQYLAIVKSLLLSISNFVTYFKISNISFSSGESGYIFSSGYNNN
ncbi:MAG: hypothetical protein WCT07_01360 [Candidatus Paceibacterota bacterium]|jgi:hypothetical protein